jgi:hypothetical protein
VRAATAALLWKEGNAFAVAFFDLGAHHPRPSVRKINETLPIWTALVDEGLVAVWPGRFAVIPPTSCPRFCKIQGDIEATAATVAVYAPSARPSSTPATAPGACPALLVLGGGRECQCAHNLATGELRWPRPELLRCDRGPDPAQALRVSDDLVLAAGRQWFRVYSACSGQTLAAYRDSKESLLRVGDNDGFVYGLLVDKNLPARAGSSARIRLVRQVMVGAPLPRPDEPVPPGRSEYHLGYAKSVRNAFWIADTLLLVEDERLRAYTLP